MFLTPGSISTLGKKNPYIVSYSYGSSYVQSSKNSLNPSCSIVAFIFSYFLVCGPFHALCHIRDFDLGNTDLSYCSVSFLGDITVIPLSCVEKAEDNPLWSLKWCLKAETHLRCTMRMRACRTLAVQICMSLGYCLWHFCPLYRSHFSSFCHLNSLDFLMMAWTIGQPSISPSVLKTQVNLLMFIVPGNTESE